MQQRLKVTEGTLSVTYAAYPAHAPETGALNWTIVSVSHGKATQCTAECAVWATALI